MTQFHRTPEQFLEYLKELDPEDIVSELQLSSALLCGLLEDYIYDYFDRNHAEEETETTDSPSDC